MSRTRVDRHSLALGHRPRKDHLCERPRRWTRPLLVSCSALLALCTPLDALADSSVPAEVGASLSSLLVIFAAPLLLVALSAFAKVAVVLAVLRNAFGSNDIPPALVSTALAALLSAIILAPVFG